MLSLAAVLLAGVALCICIRALITGARFDAAASDWRCPGCGGIASRAWCFRCGRERPGLPPPADLLDHAGGDFSDGPQARSPGSSVGALHAAEHWPATDSCPLKAGGR